MLDPKSIEWAVQTALADERVQRHILEARAENPYGEPELWFVLNIAPAATGRYQLQEAAEALDVTLATDDDEEWGWQQVQEAADELMEKVDVTIPSDTSIHINLWPNGGCYGVILMYDPRLEGTSPNG